MASLPVLRLDGEPSKGALLVPSPRDALLVSFLPSGWLKIGQFLALSLEDGEDAGPDGVRVGVYASKAAECPLLGGEAPGEPPGEAAFPIENEGPPAGGDMPPIGDAAPAIPDIIGGADMPGIIGGGGKPLPAEDCTAPALKVG